MQGHLGRDYEGQVEELLNNDPFSEDKLWLGIRDTLVIVLVVNTNPVRHNLLKSRTFYKAKSTVIQRRIRIF